jgi:ABC-2 type transport system ATP-binding protein
VCLEVIGLGYSYGERKAVDGVSLEIRPGEIFGLLGPNGAGKTTTISCISGHRNDFRGLLKMNGSSFLPSSRTSDRSLLGVVPQELAIYETLTAWENVILFSRLVGVPKSKLRDNAKRLLEFAGLESRQNDLVKEFSGGMKRRLNLICGLVNNPRLVLLDEPTVGVDPQSRNHLFDSIERLKSEGTSILYTTHYMEEAERLCDRIAIMNEGKIMASGTSEELRTLAHTPDASLEEVFLQFTGRSLRDES